jgi:hypothetical protein
MNNDERVHACLDGELSPEALTPAERARLAALESAIGDAAGVLRAAPVPDFTARVMASLPAPRTAPALGERLAALWSWVWEPRMVTFRPAYAFAGALSIALAAVAVPQVMAAEFGVNGVTASAVAEPPAGTQRLYVQFRLDAPEASRVTLAGSFNEWQPTLELREAAPGVWTALVPLDPGVYDYTFVVDGERWVPDPYASQVDDSFGGTNSRLFLPAPAGSV